jgi:GSH-dependent disulfide-bond oxidoreductase
MLKFYYSGAPNPTKVALFLEETGTPYEPIPIDTRKGEQHKPEFLAVNPNAKLPAIVDGDVIVFDSSAILLYLAEKTGKFLPARTDKARAELLSWMFFVAVRGRPLFRAISAFPKLCARKDSLRHQSLCVFSAATR